MQISRKKTEASNEMCITPLDISELSSQMWLSDKHINAGTVLLRKHFPNVNGLRSTFDKVIVAKTDTKHVQIHHVDGNHWITSVFMNGSIMVRDTGILYFTVGNSTIDSSYHIYYRYI